MNGSHKQVRCGTNSILIESTSLTCQNGIPPISSASQFAVRRSTQRENKKPKKPWRLILEWSLCPQKAFFKKTPPLNGGGAGLLLLFLRLDLIPADVAGSCRDITWTNFMTRVTQDDYYQGSREKKNLNQEKKKIGSCARV